MDTSRHGVGQFELGSGTLPSAQAQNLSEPGFVCIGVLTQIIFNQQKEINDLKQQAIANEARLVLAEKTVASTQSLTKRKFDQDPVALEVFHKLAKRVEILEAREKQVVRVHAVPIQETSRIGIHANIPPTSNSGLQQERCRDLSTAKFSEMMEDTAKWVNAFMKDFIKWVPDMNKWEEDRRMFEGHVEHIVTPEELREILTWKPEKEATMQNAEKVKWEYKYQKLREWAKKYKSHREHMKRTLKNFHWQKISSDAKGRMLTGTLEKLRYCQSGGRPALTSFK